VDFGTTRKGEIPESTGGTTGNVGPENFERVDSSYAVHTLSLYSTFTKDADEKFQFKAKPSLKLEMYTKIDTTTWDYDDRPSSDDGEEDDGTQTAFRLTPAIELGVSWKLHQKFTLYTGTKVMPLVLTTYKTTEGDDDSMVKDTKESYLQGASVAGATFPHPSSALSLALPTAA
jgi:hypothetical protein